MKKSFALVLALLSSTSFVSAMKIENEVIEEKKIISHPKITQEVRKNSQFCFYEGVNGIGRSNLFHHLGAEYPMVPLFHPLDPLSKEATTIPFVMRFSSPDARKGLPQPIQDKIGSKITPLIYVIAQTLPWKLLGEKIRFYPHFATDNPSREQEYLAIRSIETTLFGSDSQKVCFNGHKPNEFIKDSIKLLTSGPKSMQMPRDIILDKDNLQVLGLSQGQSVWSAVFYNDGMNDRAIITLHWLLNGPQLQELSQTLTENSKIDTHQSLRGLFSIINELPSFKNKGGHVVKINRILDALNVQAPLTNEVISQKVKPFLVKVEEQKGKIIKGIRKLALNDNELSSRIKAISENANKLFTKNMNEEELTRITTPALKLPANEITSRVKAIYANADKLLTKDMGGYERSYIIESALQLDSQEITARAKSIAENESNLFTKEMNSCLRDFPRFQIIKAALELPTNDITPRAKAISENKYTLFTDTMCGFDRSKIIARALRLDVNEIKSRIKAISENVDALFTKDMGPFYRSEIIAGALRLDANEIKSRAKTLSENKNTSVTNIIRVRAFPDHLKSR